MGFNEWVDAKNYFTWQKNGGFFGRVKRVWCLPPSVLWYFYFTAEDSLECSSKDLLETDLLHWKLKISRALHRIWEHMWRIIPKKTLLLLSNIFHYCAAFCLRQCKITFWNFSLDNSNFCAKKHWPIKEPFWDKNKIFCRFILDNVYFEVGFHMKKLCDWRWQRFYQECSYVLCVLLSYAIYLLSSFIFCCGAIELQCNAKQLIPWNVCVYMSLDKDALSSTFVS